MADPHLLEILAHGFDGAAKKRLSALADHLINGAPSYPVELFEWDLIKETGWTFDELDRQDMQRVLPALRLAQLRDSAVRVLAYLETLGEYKPGPEDLQRFGELSALLDTAVTDG